MADWSQTWTFFDGEWREGNLPLWGVRTHAIWLGSSVFDGARVFEGVAPDLELHCARVNASAKAMLKTDEGILSLRGRWFEWRATSGDEGGDETAAVLPAMPTLHPAYLLRDPSKKKLAWEDLKAVNAALARVGIHPPRPAAG